MAAERAGWSNDGRPLSSQARAAERLRDLLQWAVLAPSRHNTQPWLFEIEGDELRIYADRTRTLPVADPDGRQIMFRLGYGLEPRAVPRRAVDQVLRRLEHAPRRPAALVLRPAPAVVPWTAAQPVEVGVLAAPALGVVAPA